MEKRTNTMDNPLSSKESFEQQWSHVRGQIKSWWDRLSEAEIEQVSGQKAQLVRLVQERYGYARERAEQEVDQRLREYSEKAEGIAASVADKAGEIGTRAQEMATAAAASMKDRFAGVSLQDMPGDLVGVIRRYPIPSLLVGIGVGFLLARAFGPMGLMSSSGENLRSGAGQSQAGYPDATIQCLRCGELVRQGDMVSHSTTCTGSGMAGHGGSPT